MKKRQVPALTEEIPDHLKPYIAHQDASLYTPIDHASWRFILRIAQAFFSKHAHQKYLDGLKETGISTERIPLVEEMDQKLRRFGWRAVPVSGFIPPAVFLEFQSMGILPIACEMRTLEHLAYTPAPDIVHEAAGHAPIIADPEYAGYLRNYGEISRKAIFSKQDMEVYEGIRNLSVVKEDPASSPEQIQVAQKQLDDAIASVDYISEATYLARMSWWTIEYGLVLKDGEPKIYGAGLLSSVGESYHCLSEGVQKLTFDMDCIHTTYDITRPQPQLFVTPDFATLTQVLEVFADTMAFKKGGVEGLEKIKQAQNITTTELDSGIQISGVLKDFLKDSQGLPSYLKFQGPTQLAYQDQEIENQGPKYHRDGFSTPVGRIAGVRKNPSDLTDQDLGTMGFISSKPGTLQFESGVTVQGVLKGKVQKNGKNLILIFENCTVKNQNEVLFQPDWGTFDMACGATVPSVFGGAADRSRYIAATGGFNQVPRKPKSNLTNENRELNLFSQKIRMVRESGKMGDDQKRELETIHAELEKKFPEDWLLRWELLELNSVHQLNASWENPVRQRLQKISTSSKVKSELISRGLALI